MSRTPFRFPYVHAIQVSRRLSALWCDFTDTTLTPQVAWCSRNSGSVEGRTVSASLYNMSVQVSAIIGANREFVGFVWISSSDKYPFSVYQASDKPRYYKANKAIVGVIVFNLVSTLFDPPRQVLTPSSVSSGDTVSGNESLLPMAKQSKGACLGCDDFGREEQLLVNNKRQRQQIARFPIRSLGKAKRAVIEYALWS